MQMPLEIAFHHIERSEQAENEIRTHVADLEKIYERLVSAGSGSTSAPGT